MAMRSVGIHFIVQSIQKNVYHHMLQQCYQLQRDYAQTHLVQQEGKVILPSVDGVSFEAHRIPGILIGG